MNQRAAMITASALLIAFILASACLPARSASDPARDIERIRAATAASAEKALATQGRLPHCVQGRFRCLA